MSFLYLFKNLWRFSQQDKWKVILSNSLHFVSLSGPLIRPYAFGKFIGNLEQHKLQHLDLTLRWLALYFAGFAIFELFHRAARHLQISSALNARERFTIDGYRILNSLPLSWHTDHHSGEVVNRINHAGEALEDFGVTTDNYIEQAIQSIGPVLVLLSLAPDVAVVTIAIGSLTLGIAFWLNHIIHPILSRQKNALHMFTSRLLDYVANIKTVITLRRHSETQRELVRRFRTYSKEVLRENSINQPRCFILSLGAIAMEIAALLYYISKCRNSGIVLEVGFLVMVYGYARQISEAMFCLASGFYDLLRQKAACESAASIYEPNIDGLNISPRSVSEWNRVDIVGLQYRHSPSIRLIESVDLCLKRGERIALIGDSGCGKTTLLRLIRGLHTTETGQIHVDGAPQEGIGCMADMSTLFEQSPDIFEHTILFNITMGVDEDSEHLNRAIHMSQLHSVIQRLPNGVHTDIRERGVNLSGGERKRLALARGLFSARDSSLLLLDEPTANIDRYHEAEIYDGIFAHFKRACIVCTTHGPHLLGRFDRIYELRSGKLVETEAPM